VQGGLVHRRVVATRLAVTHHHGQAGADERRDCVESAVVVGDEEQELPHEAVLVHEVKYPQISAHIMIFIVSAATATS